ncbi:S1C family serine protease [Pseudomonas juntendi]|nr:MULTISPECIES: trypsin-like peptidase domain-containing protein [Pseudomonas]MDG9887542.1 S1C family serine protease [Pseudomonas juntendi]
MTYPDPYSRPAPDRFSRRWLVITGCIAALMLLWQFLPAIEAWFSPHETQERTVTPRGDLAADEKTTIELFEKSRGSVVYITTAQLVRDVWSRNVFSVPRGTGSGFIRDDAGHVVTNFHVIQGASSATVKLADGRDYQAALVGASPAHDIAVLKIGVGFTLRPTTLYKPSIP